MAKRITIQLIGASADKQDVRIDDFIKQLARIREALRETELNLTGNDKPLLDYKIVGLRHSSPSEIDLEPVNAQEKEPPPKELGGKVIAHFSSELRLIRTKGQLLTRPDLPRLKAYQEIGSNPDNRIAEVKIKVGRTATVIDDKFKKKLDKIVGPDETVHGSIAGMLEAVNFHNTNKFTLYPPLGPRRIHGAFRAGLRPKVKEAIGSFVTAIGVLSYKAWSPYPHAIYADDIDIHEPESELPTLSDLRGAFAGSTGDMNSVEFIDHLRSEDW